MKRNRPGLHFTFNAPAVLGFTAVCFAAQILNIVTMGGSNVVLFSVYRSSLMDPLTYLRCFCHVFGHSGWDHLLNNVMYILILGPMLEEKYGSANILKVIAVTALVTGIVNPILFPQVRLLGASGVVFAFILLSSITVTQDGGIPVTFILVAALYLGRQVYQGIFVRDSVSQLTHIIGGLVGSVLGFMMNGGSLKRRRK